MRIFFLFGWLFVSETSKCHCFCVFWRAFLVCYPGARIARIGASRSRETRVVSLCCCSSGRSCMMPAKVGCCNVWRRRERNVLKAITSLCHFGKLVVVSLPRSYEEQKSASVQSVPAVYAAWDCLLPRALFFLSLWIFFKRNLLRMHLPHFFYLECCLDSHFCRNCRHVGAKTSRLYHAWK